MYDRLEKRRTIPGYHRIDATAVIDELRAEIREKGGLPALPLFLDPRTIAYAESLLRAVNEFSYHFECLRYIQSEYQPRQEMCFVPSNLRKGCIFYFRCIGCGLPVKHLYTYSLEQPNFKCRKCLHLRYKASARSDADIMGTQASHNYNDYVRPF